MFYEDKDKLIFKYCVGRDKDFKSVERFCDPIAFWNKLVVALDGNAQEAIDDIRQVNLGQDGEPMMGPDGKPKNETASELLFRVTAERRLWEAVRVAGDMLPYDPETGAGATDQHCMQLFYGYMDWVLGEESGDEAVRTGSAATDSSQSLVP